MTRYEAQLIAQGVRDNLPIEMRQRLKSMDIIPKLHNGMMTIRVYMVNKTADEPEPHIFSAMEI